MMLGSDGVDDWCTLDHNGDWGAFDGHSKPDAFDRNSRWGAWTGDGTGVMKVGQILRYGNCRLTKPLQLKRNGDLVAVYKPGRISTYSLELCQNFGEMFELYCVVASTVFYLESFPQAPPSYTCSLSDQTR